MQVHAIRQGFYGSLREPGDEFEVPDGDTGSWFVPVSPDDDADAAAASPEEPHLAARAKRRRPTGDDAAAADASRALIDQIEE